MNAQTSQYMTDKIQASSEIFKQFVAKNKGKAITFVTGYGLQLQKIVVDVCKDYFTTRGSLSFKVDGIYHFHDTTFVNDDMRKAFETSLLVSQENDEQPPYSAVFFVTGQVGVKCNEKKTMCPFIFDSWNQYKIMCVLNNQQIITDMPTFNRLNKIFKKLYCKCGDVPNQINKKGLNVAKKAHTRLTGAQWDELSEMAQEYLENNIPDFENFWENHNDVDTLPDCHPGSDDETEYLQSEDESEQNLL